MTFPQVTVEAWRAQVEKELAGASFDKVLVNKLAEGLAVAPLYTEAPGDVPQLASSPGAASFLVCSRVGSDALSAVSELEEGADALWLDAGPALDAALALPAGAPLLIDVSDDDAGALVDRLAGAGRAASASLLLDPIGALARGAITTSALSPHLSTVAEAARAASERAPGMTTALVSTSPYHDAGADGADELSAALSTGVVYLEALLAAGLAPAQAAAQIALRVSVGRDTFAELCKLRALRICWQKVLAAFKASDAPRAKLHAVCSARTLTQRDPWVNMLRATTQVFAAVLGGADLVTASSFDDALGSSSALGRRVARNTGLVLRDESFLGKVSDPAGGSYYLETLTDGLAREAWRRFQKLQASGGIIAALSSGGLAARIDDAWQQRLSLIAKRQAPILGVSEFANLTETLPRAPHSSSALGASSAGLPVRRDAERFEELRLRADVLQPEAVLRTLGAFAASRPRAGFAANFFAAGGIRTRETSSDEPAPLVCLCGSDESYAAEAIDRARALKAAGCKIVLLAGRPGALEEQLRQAGVDGFVFLGCDVVATLSDLLDALS